MAEERKIYGRSILFIRFSLTTIFLFIATLIHPFINTSLLLNSYIFDQSLSSRRINNVNQNVIKISGVEGITMHEIDDGVHVSDYFKRCATSTYLAFLEPGKSLEYRMPKGSFIVTALGKASLNGDEVVQGQSTGAQDWDNEVVTIRAGEKGAILLFTKPDLKWWQNPDVRSEVLAQDKIEGTDFSWQEFESVPGLHNWSGQIKINVEIGGVVGEIRINDWFLETPQVYQNERSAGIHDHSPVWWIEDEEQGYTPTVEFHFGLGNPYRLDEAVGYMVEYGGQRGDVEIDRVPVYYASTHSLFCQMLPDGTLQYPPHAWVAVERDDNLPSFWGVVEVGADLWKTGE